MLALLGRGLMEVETILFSEALTLFEADFPSAIEDISTGLPNRTYFQASPLRLSSGRVCGLPEAT